MYSILKMGIFHCYVWLPEGTSGQITVIPKPECFGDLGGIPLINHHLGWPRRVGRYNLPRYITVVREWKNIYIFIYIFYIIHFCPKILRWPRTLKVLNTICTTDLWVFNLPNISGPRVTWPWTYEARIKLRRFFLFTGSSSVTPQLQHVLDAEKWHLIDSWPTRIFLTSSHLLFFFLDCWNPTVLIISKSSELHSQYTLASIEVWECFTFTLLVAKNCVFLCSFVESWKMKSA